MKMKHFYCSILSKDYSFKGLLLYQSLEKFDPDFHFFMFFLHEEVKSLYEKMNLKNATLISLAEVEQYDQDLLKVKDYRSDKEYIWTAKASVCLYLLERFAEVDHLVWLDGDTYFYADPGPVFTEWDNYSIMLTPERWRKPDMEMGPVNGFYNTGFMGFKRDSNALCCLGWFREKLIEWCYDRREPGLWSDQVYVNDWLTRFQNVGVIQNLGVNLTPYITDGYPITKKDDILYINDDPIIFCHYYGFKYYDGNEFDLCYYNNKLSDEALRWLYMPYIDACLAVMAQIKSSDNGFYDRVYERYSGKENKKHLYFGNYFNLQLNTTANCDGLNFCTIVDNNRLLQGVAMLNSLREHIPHSHFWVCCIDNPSYDSLLEMNLENVTLFSLKNMCRNIMEGYDYSQIARSWFIYFLLNNHYHLNSVLFVAPEMFFFRDFRDVLSEWGQKDAIICGPKSEPGLIGFKRNPNGLKLLMSWMNECFYWYFDKVESPYYGGGRYVGVLLDDEASVAVIDSQSINANPADLGELKLSQSEDRVDCNGKQPEERP